MLPAIWLKRRAGDQSGVVRGRNTTQRAISSAHPATDGISGRIDFSSTSLDSLHHFRIDDPGKSHSR